MTNHIHCGFGNYCSSEAIAGALPKSQNSPQRPPLGLYAEQVNGSAFTAPRSQNFHNWLYRIRPSVKHTAPATLVEWPFFCDSHTATAVKTPPEPLRWDPLPLQQERIDFFQSLFTMVYNPVAAIHLYHCNNNKPERFFYNTDGDWLIVPEQGSLLFQTELGPLTVKPGEILVIQRGIRFRVTCLDPIARGYIVESQATAFCLPERGPIGANGLAEERFFTMPSASYEDKQGDFELFCKFQGNVWRMPIQYSPLDVVAWHGNYLPYHYDLATFTPLFSALKDHADPSIFTVLTAPSLQPGTANIDFVIFPQRWMVAENTFRPPYYHRNLMSEFMGLIHGEYDAKKNGFLPGGASLHNCMTGHGVDSDVFKASTEENTALPRRLENTLAFMFESRAIWQVTQQAWFADFRQKDYLNCWQSLTSHFSGVK